jgi:hypothetical protein
MEAGNPTKIVASRTNPTTEAENDAGEERRERNKRNSDSQHMDECRTRERERKNHSSIVSIHGVSFRPPLAEPLWCSSLLSRDVTDPRSSARHSVLAASCRLSAAVVAASWSCSLAGVGSPPAGWLSSPFAHRHHERRNEMRGGKRRRGGGHRGRGTRGRLRQLRLVGSTSRDME